MMLSNNEVLHDLWGLRYINHFLIEHARMLANDDPTEAECERHLDAWDQLLEKMSHDLRAEWFQKAFPGECDPEGN